MKTFSSIVLVASLVTIVTVAPVTFASETSAVTNETSARVQTAKAKQKPGAKKASTDSGSTDTDDDKSTTEKLQEGFDTAKEAYEKVGVEIFNGNYGKALDGTVEMGKDKMIEKAEDALKKKNENLYKAYKLGKDIKDDVQKGDYAEVWKTTKDAAYDEAKEYIEDKVIEKLIPGYGQMKGAWDTGYATGELVGQIPISADGKTINNLAEDQFQSTFFSGQDSATAKQLADEEIIQAFVKSVQNGEVGLPEGLNYGETTAKIRFNLDNGFPPLDAIELSPGTNELALLVEQKTPAPVAPEVEVLEKPDSTPAESEPVPEPEPAPEIDNPWVADSTTVIQNEPEVPQEKPVEDIWDTDDSNDSLLDEQRYQLQQQLDAEKERERAIAENQTRNEFYAAQAKREEEARIKAEKNREFREGMNALAQGLGQIAQQVQEAQQQSGPPQSVSSAAGSNTRRAASPADKAAAIYQMCVNRTGDKNGCRNMANTGVKLESDLSRGKIPMDFIEKICRDAADSQKNYDRCVRDKVAEMKRRMN